MSYSPMPRHHREPGDRQAGNPDVKGKRYSHLLSQEISPVDRARMRAEKERERVLKQAKTDVTNAWLDYAREQAEGWQRVLQELERL